MAFADIALALPAGTSEFSRALALATDGGIVVEPLPLTSATSVSSGSSVAFLSAEDFSAALPDFRCACFFEWRGLVYLLSAIGAPAVFSDFEVAIAVSSPGSACDGPAKHIKSPVARINAERPLALMIIWQSPHLPSPKAK
ncbi:MAG: hypothetical protein Q8M18_21205 [Bradyrhizobium sp.]|nr:hypothetical protein [Bradyrhizobium sp.]